MIDKELAERIGCRLKKLRLGECLTDMMTIEFLSDCTEVSPFSLHKYEIGQRMPSAMTLIKLADFYNVSTDYILCREDK